jgi:hypothetical protein
MILLQLLLVIIVVLHGDYNGYQLPVTPIQEFFLSNLASGLPSLLEITILCWSVPLIFKASGGPKKDGFGTPLLLAMRFALSLFFLLAIVWTLYGIANGQQFRIAMWQIRPMPYVLCWAFIGFHVCDTPSKATRLLNTFLKSVAVKAAIIALYFHVAWNGSKLRPSGDSEFEYVTSHWDGMFAGIALVLTFSRLLTIKQWSKRIPLLAQAALIGYGWMLNDRRISFLGVLFSMFFLTVIFASKMPRAKLLRYIPHAIALGCVGLAAILVPASPLHSLIADDPSGQLDYRDIENYNLFRMTGEKSILGWGYGRPFEQYFPLPDIFGFAEVLSWIPHNNILMTWAFAGVFGLSALGLVFSFGTAVSVRLLGATTDTATKVFAASAFSAVVQWVFYAWADMGLTVSVMTPVPACLIGISARLLLKANSEGATRILERG